ncbi:hypothetical protein STEG23_021344 [Scotinomys teguina]
MNRQQESTDRKQSYPSSSQMPGQAFPSDTQRVEFTSLFFPFFGFASAGNESSQSTSIYVAPTYRRGGHFAHISDGNCEAGEGDAHITPLLTPRLQHRTFGDNKSVCAPGLKLTADKVNSDSRFLAFSPHPIGTSGEQYGGNKWVKDTRQQIVDQITLEISAQDELLSDANNHFSDRLEGRAREKAQF